MSNYWIARACEVIAVVKQAHPEATGEELRALLHEAYPFGERKHHPYKVWLSCVRDACHIEKKARSVESLPLFEQDLTGKGERE